MDKRLDKEIKSPAAGEKPLLGREKRGRPMRQREEGTIRMDDG